MAAFDDINTPSAITIWLNSLVTYFIGLIYIVIYTIHVLANHDFHRPTQRGHDVIPGYSNPLHTHSMPETTIVLLLAYLVGAYAYRNRDCLSRIFAMLLGITLLMDKLVATLATESAMQQTQSSSADHVFLYIALSQLLYGVFGRCKAKGGL